ncbi:hypothetical protein G6F56_000199 [Rhizopus delemar]|uniref:Kinase-like protein n=1 Tax=Rhizopus stolonifer TaxID=4846 RepID=A0A367KU40_RHIST|nr:hypothetical protein G6F56_000199 [Rhizopus delemar]RCI05667.1 hypothetical protein CU098_012099 [Rhizopus stolonifer]
MGNTCSNTHNPPQVVNLSQFQVIKSIGQGSFCKVYKVQHVQRKKLYALKVINKEKCVEMKAVHNVIRERKILENLNHPLICNIRFAFQDIHSMYLAVDLMSAGDLRQHIAHTHYDEESVRFWISELICAVKYLHSQKIVHRDIKPDNILLDQEGHIHLTDFNIACELPKNKFLTSLSGTATYFAPEVFKGQGYDENVDWWCVGVTFYECVYKKRPWPSCKDIEELKRQVLSKSIQYPSSFASLPCKLAIKDFLEKNPKERLGYGITSGWRKIMTHPFFESIDWYSIDNKQTTPVYTPQMIKDDQTSFEPDRIEQPQRTNRRLSKEDIKILKERFEPFDYTVFEEYKGLLDENLMTVGPPPTWVKPAFPGADNGCILPVNKICLEHLPSVLNMNKMMHPT